MYSELLTAATFVSENAHISFPPGNQAGWDLIVRPDSEKDWLRVQVKTVGELRNGESPTVQLSRRGHRTTYGPDEIEVLVAVHPETGTLWKVPVEAIGGVRTLHLTDEYLWRGSVDHGGMLRLVVKPNGTIKRANARMVASERLPDEQPDWIQDSTWEMLHAWIAGRDFKAIAGDHGITRTNAKKRILRALNRLGLAELPRSIQPGRRRRYKVTRRLAAASIQQGELFAESA